MNNSIKIKPKRGSYMQRNRHKYPENWDKISYYVRFIRAGGKCEVCGAEHGKPHPENGKPTVLTVAHLDHKLDNHDLSNLKCMCSVCHLRYDAKQHVITRKYGSFDKQLKLNL